MTLPWVPSDACVARWSCGRLRVRYDRPMIQFLDQLLDWLLFRFIQCLIGAGLAFLNMVLMVLIRPDCDWR